MTLRLRDLGYTANPKCVRRLLRQMGLEAMDEPIVGAAKFRENMEGLKIACGIEQWPHNALRHSFGLCHLAFHGD